MILILILIHQALGKSSKPHIIFILADDLGWNEVSWHNPGFLTPNLESLAREGLLLNQSYVSPKCSPSRAALLTGVYPWRLGMQRGAIGRFRPTGLSPEVTLLPQHLREGGYRTHMVGKWHLGYCNKKYLPTSRGFQSFFGQLSAVTDYYTRRFIYTDFHLTAEAQDLFRDGESTTDGEGEYSTDLYSGEAVQRIKEHNGSEPLFLYVAFQAPHMDLQRPPEIYMAQYDEGVSPYQAHLTADPKAHFRAAAVTAIDTGVGRIVKALKDHGLYENSILVFSTDNGGSKRGLSNWPLKGVKEEVYEGGVRGVALLHSPLSNRKGQVEPGLMYITDWVATLLTAAGLPVPQQLDSENLWPLLQSGGHPSPRTSVILSLDQDTEEGAWTAVLRRGRHKLIWGQESLLKHAAPESSCRQQLYDLQEDPEEKRNLMLDGPNREVAGPMRAELMEAVREMVPADYPRQEPKGDPELYGGVLYTDWC